MFCHLSTTDDAESDTGRLHTLSIRAVQDYLDVKGLTVQKYFHAV